MGEHEAAYGTVWYRKIDSEEVDGIEGRYELESKGSEVIVTVYPKKESQELETGSTKMLFPWRRIMRIDAHTPPADVEVETAGRSSGDI